MFQRSFIKARRSVGHCRLSTPSIQVSSARRNTLCFDPHILVRPLSSSPPSAPRAQSSDDDSSSATDPHAAFQSSVSAKRADGIHASYPALLQVSKSLQASPTIRAELVGALQVLAVSTRLEDSDLADRILADLPLYGMCTDSSIHDDILDAILDSGDTQAAYNWVRRIRLRPGKCMATSKQWHTLLNSCGMRRDVSLAKATIKWMSVLGVQPTHDTFTLFFRALIDSGYKIPIEVVHSFAEIIKKQALPYPETLSRILSDYHMHNRQPKLAERVEEAFRLAYKTSDSPTTNPSHDVQLGAVAKKSGYKAAVRLYNDLKARGFNASESTLLAMLNETVDPSVLSYLSQHLAVTPGPAAWAKLISNAVYKSLYQAAVALYKSALSSGVRPTNVMLHPVLRALCAPSLHKPSDANVETAMDLYREYLRLYDEHGSPEPSADNDSGNSTQLDAPIYNTLLRALTSSSNTSKYFPIAVSLLEDMQSRQVQMDKMTTTSVVVMLMRSSSNFDEAFHAYKLIRQMKDTVLDQEGYVVVLSAFCKVSSSDGTPPPARLYFNIVKDMRAAGYSISSKVYTIILQQLYLLAEQLSPSFPSDDLSRLVNSIRRVHQLLLVDASLTPDTALWNQLMNTYQRAGCLSDAFRIWESLYRSRLCDNISVSIILDACSHAQEWGTIQRIYTDLLESGFPLNLRNWNNWLECLCRLGRLDDAVKTACLEMKERGVEPDESSVQIILKFSIRTNQQTEVRGRIKQYLPKLWSKMAASGLI
ncbi:hypothetical protein B0H21DRAFT_92093 [Amylocystis lapponica]|nr:hypothetical protein B0H21DRAFT_92093 [Amylocystis lapponica]